MLSKQKKIVYPYPYESTLLNLPSSVSTVCIRNSHEEALHLENDPFNNQLYDHAGRDSWTWIIDMLITNDEEWETRIRHNTVWNHE